MRFNMESPEGTDEKLKLLNIYNIYKNEISEDKVVVLVDAKTGEVKPIKREDKKPLDTFDKIKVWYYLHVDPTTSYKRLENYLGKQARNEFKDITKSLQDLEQQVKRGEVTDEKQISDKLKQINEVEKRYPSFFEADLGGADLDVDSVEEGQEQEEEKHVTDAQIRLEKIKEKVNDVVSELENQRSQFKKLEPLMNIYQQWEKVKKGEVGVAQFIDVYISEYNKLDDGLKAEVNSKIPMADLYKYSNDSIVEKYKAFHEEIEKKDFYASELPTIISQFEDKLRGLQADALRIVGSLKSLSGKSPEGKELQTKITEGRRDLIIAMREKIEQKRKKTVADIKENQEIIENLTTRTALLNQSAVKHKLEAERKREGIDLEEIKQLQKVIKDDEELLSACKESMSKIQQLYSVGDKDKQTAIEGKLSDYIKGMERLQRWMERANISGDPADLKENENTYLPRVNQLIKECRNIVTEPGIGVFIRQLYGLDREMKNTSKMIEGNRVKLEENGIKDYLTLVSQSESLQNQMNFLEASTNTLNKELKDYEDAVKSLIALQVEVGSR